MLDTDNLYLIAAKFLEEEALAGGRDRDGSQSAEDVFTEAYVNMLDGVVNQNFGILFKRTVQGPKLISFTSHKDNEVKLEIRIPKQILHSMLDLEVS